jgi:hypothetical protein
MIRRLGLAVVLVLCAASCGLLPSDDEVCDGISAEAGGCDRDQPSFAATTCGAVAAEFGRQLDVRVLAVIDGPESVGGEPRLVRMNRYMSLVVGRANQYLRSEGLIDECDDPAAFAAAAEPMFSDRLREKAGDYVFEGTRVTYQVWRDELVRVLGILAAEQ